jgi:hypothetical protein
MKGNKCKLLLEKSGKDHRFAIVTLLVEERQNKMP